MRFTVPDFGAGDFRIRLNAARLTSFVQSAGADGQEIVGAKEGLLAPVDPAKLENIGQLYDIAKPNLAAGEGPAYSIAPVGILANSEAGAARICLLGDRVGAAELLRLGVATEVVADDQVLARARELAQTIAAYPAQGITAVKQGLRAAHTRGAPEAWFDSCMPEGANA